MDTPLAVVISYLCHPCVLRSHIDLPIYLGRVGTSQLHLSSWQAALKKSNLEQVVHPILNKSPIFPQITGYSRRILPGIYPFHFGSSLDFVWDLHSCLDSFAYSTIPPQSIKAQDIYYSFNICVFQNLYSTAFLIYQ